MRSVTIQVTLSLLAVAVFRTANPTTADDVGKTQVCARKRQRMIEAPLDQAIDLNLAPDDETNAKP
jgi:hypothetical protein